MGEVGDDLVNHAPHHFVDEPSFTQARMGRTHRGMVPAEQRQLIQFIKTDQTGTQAIVDVVMVVGDFIRHIGQLRLERRLLTVQEAAPQFAKRRGVTGAAVLQNSFARLESKVQAGKGRVLFFQLVDHAQALQVVLEAAVLAHAIVQRVLAGVPKGRVPEVVR